jgi:hypothetical protein
MRIVTVARKPCAATSATGNVVTLGCGVLNIDACRVPDEDGRRRGVHRRKGGRLDGVRWSGDRPRQHRDVLAEPHPGGRWPANVVVGDGVMPAAMAGFFARLAPRVRR